MRQSSSHQIAKSVRTATRTLPPLREADPRHKNIGEKLADSRHRADMGVANPSFDEFAMHCQQAGGITQCCTEPDVSLLILPPRHACCWTERALLLLTSLMQADQSVYCAVPEL